MYTVIHPRITRPLSYMPFAFDIDATFSDICTFASDRSESKIFKTLARTDENQDDVNCIRSERYDKFIKSEPKEVAFTFFGPKKNPKETAVIHCWPLEQDVAIGAFIWSKGRKQ